MSTRPSMEPRDVLPENAQLILNSLNAATSAQELAAAIEIPDELDIGINLAQRLLNRRDQLGGFTTLQQVADVPLIGPKRFTDIVVALSPQRIPGQAASPLEVLQQEIAELRRSIVGGGGSALRRRLTLRQVEPQVFLGQIASVIATLTDGDDPVVDVPVTLLATRGELRVSDGYTTQQGHLVTARTGIDGTLRVAVQAKTGEEITQIQQDALRTQLSLLDATAETPRKTEQGLQAMAQQYAWEVNLPFRQAVDIFVRDFRPMLLDTVNVRDNLDQWLFVDSAILAFAPMENAGEAGSSVSATATLHLRALDWIGPFLETFIAQGRSAGTLEQRLRDAAQDTTETGALVNAVYEHAGKYVASRYGTVGMYVGRKVAESSIRNFLDKELPNMDLDTRVSLFPALDVASKTIATAEPSVIQGIVSTRRDISQDVDRKISTRIPTDFGTFDARVGVLENAFALAVDDNDLGNLRCELLGLIDTTRSELTNSFSQALVTKVDATTFNQSLATKVDATTFDQSLATKVDTTTFNQTMATKVDTNTFSTFQSSVDTRFSTVNTRFGQVDSRFTQVDTKFTQVDGRFGQLDTRFTQVDSRFGQLDTRFTTVDSKLSTVDTRINSIRFRNP